MVRGRRDPHPVSGVPVGKCGGSPDEMARTSGLLGMGILFILLATGKVRVHLFEVSSQFFVRHIVRLLLLAIVGVVRFWPVLKKEG
jgi:hypothetical protein